MPLSPEHVEYLSARGVTSRDVIDARGYETTSVGLRIPIHGLPDGEIVSYEVRLDNPDGRKFDRPSGVGNRLNVNPLTLSGVRDPKPALFIVEGTTRADALAAQGIPAVSVTGCWGWLDAKKGTLPEFRDIPLRGRRVIWVPDGDAWTNADVNQATHELVQFLTRKGAVVQLLEVPDGLGLDDWFAAGNDLFDMGSLTRSPEDLPELKRQPLSRDKMAQKRGLPDTTDEALAELWTLSDPSHAVRIAGTDSWYSYSSGRWMADRTRDGLDARSSLAALLTRVAQMYVDAAETDAEKAVATATYRDLRSAAKLNAVYNRFRTLPSSMVTVEDADFDRDPYLFNVRNGTLDLHTGILRPHDPGDRLRGMSGTLYDPGAVAPRWDAFLSEVFPGQADVVRYLQLVLGASLIGRPSLHILPVLVGTGRNGKGTLVRAIGHAIGSDYMGACDKTLLLSSKFESHPTKLMALKGKRLVTASETEAGEKLATASLKMLTGGDEISARGMREDQQTFMPSHSMVLQTNNLPEADAMDVALWARLRLIRFSVSFADEPDLKIDEKLAAEAEGILAWLVAGCRLFLDSDALETPLAVTMATGDWQMGENSFAQFASARLIRDPKGHVKSSDLIEAYRRFCAEAELEQIHGRKMGQALREYGAETDHKSTHRGWKGVRLSTTDSIMTETVTETSSTYTTISPGQSVAETEVTLMTPNPGVDALRPSDPPSISPTTMNPPISASEAPLPSSQPSDLQKQADATATEPVRRPCGCGLTSWTVAGTVAVCSCGRTYMEEWTWPQQRSES